MSFQVDSYLLVKKPYLGFWNLISIFAGDQIKNEAAQVLPTVLSNGDRPGWIYIFSEMPISTE